MTGSASGEWSKVSKAACLAAARGTEPKIAIDARAIDNQLLDFAAAVEKEISDDPELQWSFLEIIDEQGASRGGWRQIVQL